MSVPWWGLGPGPDARGSLARVSTGNKLTAPCQNPSSVFLYNSIKFYSFVMFSPTHTHLCGGSNLFILLLVINPE